MGQQHEEAGHRGCERKGDPGEQDQEERQHHGFEDGDPADLQHTIHLIAAGTRERRRRE